MFNITPMSLEHIDGVYAVEQRSFSTPWSRASIEADLLNPHAHYIVAINEDTGEILGYTSMWHVVNEGHINNIAVDEPYRRQGVGTAMINTLVKIAQSKEMIGLTLEVRMGNRAAMSLYHKFGFKAEGIRKGYYSDTKEDAVIMWKYFDH